MAKKVKGKEKVAEKAGKEENKNASAPKPPAPASAPAPVQVQQPEADIAREELEQDNDMTAMGQSLRYEQRS
jgi:hypothetical protein